MNVYQILATLDASSNKYVTYPILELTYCFLFYKFDLSIFKIIFHFARDLSELERIKKLFLFVTTRWHENCRKSRTIFGGSGYLSAQN